MWKDAGRSRSPREWFCAFAPTFREEGTSAAQTENGMKLIDLHIKKRQLHCSFEHSGVDKSAPELFIIPFSIAERPPTTYTCTPDGWPFDNSASTPVPSSIESTLHSENLSFIGSLKKDTFAAETENEKILLHLTKKKRILRYSKSAVRGWPKVNRGIIFVFYRRAATSRVSSEECPSPPSEQ